MAKQEFFKIESGILIFRKKKLKIIQKTYNKIKKLRNCTKPVLLWPLMRIFT